MTIHCCKCFIDRFIKKIASKESTVLLDLVYLIVNTYHAAKEGCGAPDRALCARLCGTEAFSDVGLILWMLGKKVERALKSSRNCSLTSVSVIQHNAQLNIKNQIQTCGPFFHFIFLTWAQNWDMKNQPFFNFFVLDHKTKNVSTDTQLTHTTSSRLEWEAWWYQTGPSSNWWCTLQTSYKNKWREWKDAWAQFLPKSSSCSE